MKATEDFLLLKQVDVASLFSNFPMRSTGNSVRSTLSNHSCGKANLSRSSRKGAENSGSDPFINSKTVWPVTFCEVPFLPEFPVRGSVDESDFDVRPLEIRIYFTDYYFLIKFYHPILLLDFCFLFHW